MIRNRTRNILAFDVAAEAEESFVPLSGYERQVAADFAEAATVQSPTSFATMPGAANQSRVLHSAQVFCDGLASDAGTNGECGDGGRAIAREARNQSQARGVRQDGKQRCGAEKSVRRLWITVSGQGASR